MDRISLYKKLSLVGIMAVSCFASGLAQAQSVEYTPRPYDPEVEKQREQNRKDERTQDRADKDKDRRAANRKQCQEALDKITKAQTKFLGTCRTSGAGTVKECSEILEDCESNALVADILDPVQVVGQMIGAPSAASSGNKCSEYAYTDYKSEMKDLKSEKKDAEKEIKELQKERIEKEKEIGEARAKLAKELAQERKEKAKEDLEEKEQELNMQKERQNQERELRKKMRDIETAISKANNDKAIMAASRAGEVEKFKASLMICDATAEKQLKELQGNTSSSLANRTAVAGSLNSAGAAKGNKKNAKATLMKGCVAEVTAKRNAEAVAFQNKMKEKDEEVAKLMAERQETQTELQNLAMMFEQSMQNRKNKKAQEDAAAQAELDAKRAEMDNLNREFVQQQERIATALRQASIALNQADTDVKNLEKEKPKTRGSKSAKETMTEAQQEYNGVSCSAVCSEDGVTAEQRSQCNDTQTSEVKTKASEPPPSGATGTN